MRISLKIYELNSSETNARKAKQILLFFPSKQFMKPWFIETWTWLGRAKAETSGNITRNMAIFFNIIPTDHFQTRVTQVLIQESRSSRTFFRDFIPVTHKKRVVVPTFYVIKRKTFFPALFLFLINGEKKV